MSEDEGASRGKFCVTENLQRSPTSSQWDECRDVSTSSEPHLVLTRRDTRAYRTTLKNNTTSSVTKHVNWVLGLDLFMMDPFLGLWILPYCAESTGGKQEPDAWFGLGDILLASQYLRRIGQ